MRSYRTQCFSRSEVDILKIEDGYFPYYFNDYFFTALVAQDIILPENIIIDSLRCCRLTDNRQSVGIIYAAISFGQS